ncbi:hypothetical protein SAMN02745823_01591 [Sporobacter termitidis DSM 10068]|uniref:Flavodoxin-like fold n=1 Tax=Sporobacter termitidis DSM 10068 TaxID=1123282 RepID=A0A1M5X4T7_9FIRM|nr:hypothetical protein [Sporobacter termitidis]SHH94612.1 hypothetical protein SAMN02745823_01591 [Sporobacter termitidis DSM 10068]
MNSAKTVSLIAASPKVGEAAVSDWLSDRAKKVFSGGGVLVHQINVRQSAAHRPEDDFERMRLSDALIFIFPLYFFCLPGLLIRYLQDFEAYLAAREAAPTVPRVFCAVNCGFPEPGINEEAVRVVKSFSEKIGASFGFGLMIGGGGMLLPAQEAPFMKKTLSAIDAAFERMRTDLTADPAGETANLEVKAAFPRRLYFAAASLDWISSAKKNGLKKRDLYARPYV